MTPQAYIRATQIRQQIDAIDAKINSFNSGTFTNIFGVSDTLFNSLRQSIKTDLLNQKQALQDEFLAL